MTSLSVKIVIGETKKLRIERMNSGRTWCYMLTLYTNYWRSKLAKMSVVVLSYNINVVLSYNINNPTLPHGVMHTKSMQVVSFSPCMQRCMAIWRLLYPRQRTHLFLRKSKHHRNKNNNGYEHLKLDKCYARSFSFRVFLFRSQEALSLHRSYRTVSNPRPAFSAFGTAKLKYICAIHVDPVEF